LSRWFPKRLGTFAAGTGPVALAFDGENMWVANQGSNNVTKLRASDGSVLGSFPVGNLPQSVVFDGANIWVTNFSSNSVTKLRASDGALIGTFPTGQFPEGAAFDGANVWVVDAPGQIITKMNPQGKTIMTLGTRGKRGQNETSFYLPTDIGFAPNGELIVADGYGNARIVRFSKDGKYLGAFGSRGNAPGEFQLPHNVVVDAKGLIYVSDRDNQRIEVFDSQGKYLRQWEHVGGLSSLIMTPDQQIWAGGVLRDLEGKAIESLPGEGADSNAHGGAIAPNGDVYIGLLNGTVKKFVRQ